jgi:hypothetical protein
MDCSYHPDLRPGCRAPSRLDDIAGKSEGAFTVGKLPIQLRLFDRQEDFLESGARYNPHSLQVFSCDQLRRADLLRGSFGKELADEVVGIKIAMA